MYKVLLVEDDEVIAKIIMYYLSECGEYDVFWVKSAEEAAQFPQERDIVLLDIMLPGMDGIELCQQLRKITYCPIIFISCVDDETTIVHAFEAGGDDYLTKPFNCAILNARIKANLRRMHRQMTKKTEYMYEDFTIDTGSHAIIRDGIKIPLAPIEFDLLLYMANHPGRIITPDELFEAVWNRPSFGDVRTVIVHVYNIRKKIESNTSEPRYIRNVRGMGYVFNAD